MTPLPQTIDRTQRHTLRELARHVADIAALPIQHTRSNLIRLLNDLNPMRPVVLAFPEGGWRELLPEASLTTTHPLLRQWESHLRATIFRHQMIGDDYPITNFFNIPWQITRSDLGLTETRSRTEVTGSYHWDAPVKSRADFQRLHHTSIQVDRPATFAIRDLAHELFADILTVRIHGSHWWTVGLTQTLVHLRGLDQMMLDM